MSFHISRREVFNNLIRFKDTLLEMRTDERRGGDKQDQSNQQKKERKYKVLLNRKTGDMRFAKKIQSLESHIAGRGSKDQDFAEWKESHIIVHEDGDKNVQFEMPDLNDIDPTAMRVANETLDVLNKKAKVSQKRSEMLPEEEALRDLSSIHMVPPTEWIEELPGWMGSIGRIEAEKILEDKPIGTYILRNGDEVTSNALFHFSEENHLWVKPFILTVVEEDEKISDVLLIQTDKGWTLYFDDPNLNDPALYHYVPTAKILLSEIQELAKTPYIKGT